jgi:hypothetical protein
MAAIGILLAICALVIGVIDLARPSSNSSSTAPTATTAVPAFTPEQVASAKKNLCSAYQVAARSVKEDTNSSDVAIARVSTTNAAGMLEVASNNPALSTTERDAAQKLASAYRNVVAISSAFNNTSPVFLGSVDEANRADAVMAGICA